MLGPADWMLPIGAEVAAELAAALQALQGRVPQRPEDAPLPALAPLLQDVAARLEHGRGFALLRGLPLDKLGETGAEAVLLVLAAHLGQALPQDAGGALIGSLGAGEALEDPPRFHADPADVVVLLCLRQAAAGGSVTLVSAAALHNALLKQDRAALAALQEPLPQRGPRGEEIALPVFSTLSGAFVARYDRDAVREAALEDAQRHALATLDTVAAAPEHALTIALHAGDLLFYNPHLVWKRRAVLDTTGETERQLLRLWLATPGSRALPESFRAIYGENAAGAPRGGDVEGKQPGEEDEGKKMVGG